MAEQASAVRDVVVVGGGAAGLSAASTLARAALGDGRRRGEPRNAPADGVHGLLALEGLSPVELLARGRDEVLGYGGEILAGEVVDELPDTPGVREQWGHDVLHCPYCHGWEVRDRRIGVLGTEPMSVHKALLFRQWSPDVVFFADDHQLAPQDRAQLDALDVSVIAGRVSRLEIDGDHVTGVRLDDGQVVAVDVVVVSTQMVARAAPFAGIGIEPTSHPAGAFIETDQFGATSVPGVWAAGNSSDLGAQVGAAAADEARAAQHINADLVMKDLDRAVAALADAQTNEGDAR